MISGSCHCGAVRFEVSPPESLTSCNCSVCRRYAALWAYAPPARARVMTAEAATLTYSWGDREILFHFCRTCGCLTHYTGARNTRIAVNLRMADDPAEVAHIPRRHFDGADSWRFLD